ncbi:CBS domain containing-hemolysin-like protein [Actinocorallia herbida]|uniref:CBS domain containing-hemolysin-like protein n=1 Tax=Actinocorallia herbida TaxID=58109 RepID=A0A3N1CZ40_9ACTN|nr:hemolysin family protein [Actinocorallia herbida]ROO86529.1 CBS domain containing-hemolysin-like protein [Actinocorallia herbida]
MTGNPWIVLAVTVAIIVLSAFFVAVEFALIAAKRHRLEDEAQTSRSARAALRSASELTVLLAGSQLGITVCTLALGAITKPAVHHWLTPVFEHWGAPLWVADAAGFVLALVIVTFLHLVIGEMAPKSWAIAHPERSATLLALPMRGFMWLTRPLLTGLNNLANRCLHRVGVDPADQVAAGQDPAALRHLVEHSANVGALDPRYSSQFSGAIDLQNLRIGELVKRGVRPTSVERAATVAEVQEVSRGSGHLRILVPGPGTDWGVVHVRDTLASPDDAPIEELIRPAYAMDGGTPVYAALTQMRETANQLVLVTEDGEVAGVVTITDVLRRLNPRQGGALTPA